MGGKQSVSTVHEDGNNDVDNTNNDVDNTNEKADGWLLTVDEDQNRNDDVYDINADKPAGPRPQTSSIITGKITYLSTNEGTIDGEYFFNRRDAPAEGLEVGRTVTYHMYRTSEEQQWRVMKILSVMEEMWDDEGDTSGNKALEDPLPLEEDINPIEACVNRRTIIGEVKSRENRGLWVRDFLQLLNGKCITRDTYVDLDKLDFGFNPLPGDILTMDAVVLLSEETIDGSGDVVEVKSIKPNQSRTDEGIVNKWERRHHHQRSKDDCGVINNDIYFEKDACDPGYIPKKGDEVYVDMIQCERGKFKWRAISVTPINFCQYTEERKIKPEKLYRVDPDLLLNKGDLVVQELTDMGALPSTGDFKIQLTVSNVGQSGKKIKYYFDSEHSNLKIVSPVSKVVTIDAQDSHTFCFDYNKEFVGYFSEVFVIQCDSFEIGREIKWEVVNADISQNRGVISKDEDRKDFENKRGEKAEKYMSIQESRGSWLLGVKPHKSAHFVAVKLLPYKVDDQIRHAMTSGRQGQLVARKDSIKALKECCPELAQNLSAQNHNRRFHHLLYIAEVDAQIDMSRHSKERVSFVRRGQASEYLALEIPGLAEGRPSLLVGDSLIASESFNKRGAPLLGYVHKVMKNEVWLKFDPYVHSTYNGEDYDVYFNVGRGCFTKCHAALDACLRNQANLWLFPKGVRSKPPQVAVEVPEDEDITVFDASHHETVLNGHTKATQDATGCVSSVHDLFESFQTSPDKSLSSISGNIVSLEEIEKSLHDTALNQKRSKTALLALVKSKTSLPSSPPKENASSDINTTGKVKLQWMNTRLNRRQKEAVRNILLGEGRPLPYIIFGPPGTGKTVTLVESVLQIYTLVSNSRILIATPSNSSANLMAERLLDSKILQPGDMVRLVAFHLVSEGKIPPKLVPYSATVNISHSAKDDQEVIDGIQTLNCKLIMSRRIIIGTCMAMGQMLRLGLPRGHFSHIVIDEAGQATEPEVLIPLAFMAHETGQAILAGDPHQLGPVVQSDIASSYGLSQSLLARLLPKFPYQRDALGFPESGGYDPRLVTRLSVNYRSLPDILELPSSLFYDSDLEPSVSDTNSFEAKLLARITQQLELPHSAVIFYGIKGDECRDEDSPSLFNVHEIYQVVSWVRRLLNAEVKSEDIGIITPYQKQVSKIRNALERHTDEEDQVQSIKIGSVEEFQGQERMVIILSTVRSTGSKHIDMIGRNTARQLLGFVNNKERLNVAISRARALLLICANPNVLAVDHYWRSVVKYCIDKKSYTGSDYQRELID